jgi:hypothetical protein
LFLGASVASLGQFTISSSGPVGSNGYDGSPENEHLTATYNGPTTVYTNLTFDARLHSVIPETYVADSEWYLSNTTYGATEFYQPSFIYQQFTDQIIHRSMDGLHWLHTGDQYDLTAFLEDDRGPGPDAQWFDLSFTWQGNDFVNLGHFGAGTNFLFDTLPSNYSETLALYSADGRVLAIGDRYPSSPGGQCLLNLGTLADGEYIMTVGGDTFPQFQNYNATGGIDAGHLGLRLNENQVYSTEMTEYNMKSFRFSVGAVPEPITILPLGFGLFLLIRNRAKRVN